MSTMFKEFGRRTTQLKYFVSCESLTKLSSDAIAKRTLESDPTNHREDQIGLFYTIPEEIKTKLFTYGGFPKSFSINLQTFGESCLMIRSPALEIMKYIKNSDLERPAVRYVIYGKPGCGKSLTLSHILHFGYNNDYYLLHVPWVWNWFRSQRTEVVYSTRKEGLVDLPILSAQWLKHFQSQNADLLLKDDITLSRDYIWNQREATVAGSKLLELVLYGINRVKYAADCIDGLIHELKHAADQNKCKVLVAIDGFNGLLDKECNYKTQDKVLVKSEMVTLTHSFIEAVKQDWINAAVIVIVDQLSAKFKSQKSHLPIYLLGKKGFEILDPFILVNVPEFTNFELHSMLDYYEDRKWLPRKGGREELSFLSNNNPYQLMNLCGGL